MIATKNIMEKPRAINIKYYMNTKVFFQNDKFNGLVGHRKEPGYNFN